MGLYNATVVSVDCAALNGSQDIRDIESYQIGGVEQDPGEGME